MILLVEKDTALRQIISCVVVHKIEEYKELQNSLTAFANLKAGDRKILIVVVVEKSGFVLFWVFFLQFWS